MRASPQCTLFIRYSQDQGLVFWIAAAVGLVLALAIFPGCGRHSPQATVEGTLRLDGKPLDNCLVTFLPMSATSNNARHSRGLTDRQGKFHLSYDNQEKGADVGSHHVTIQDMSVSTGVRRRDHGTVDAGVEESTSTTLVRRSRVPKPYTSETTTPLTKEVKPGHQIIELDIQ